MSHATPAVIRAIVAHETPPRWKVRTVRSGLVGPRGQLVAGRAIQDKRIIEIPRKRDYEALWIFFHELGHALHIIAGTFERSVAKNGQASANEEYHAETFAARKMREYGFRVDRIVLADAKRYVKAYVEQDDAIGYPVAPHVRKWVRTGDAA